jgi:ABC-type branched-subunit amino acid transport system substrate-binding protein
LPPQLEPAGQAEAANIRSFIPIITADDLTQRQRIRNVIRVAGYSASAFTHPFGDWALKKGHKRVATISQDYSFGHEQCGGFAQVFTEGGGQIVAQLWNPLNTSDFSPYLGQLAGMNIDAGQPWPLAMIGMPQPEPSRRNPDPAPRAGSRFPLTARPPQYRCG